MMVLSGVSVGKLREGAFDGSVVKKGGLVD